MNSALTQIRQEEGLEDAEDQEIILSLWQQRQGIARQLKELQMQLDDLEMDEGNVTGGLKVTV